MNKQGYWNTSASALSPAHCWQGFLAQSAHLHGGVSDDQGKSLTHDAAAAPEPRGSPGGSPSPTTLPFSYYPDHALGIHLQGVGGCMLGSPEKASHCHHNELAGGSILRWDLRRQQRGVPAAYLGFAAGVLLEGLEFLLIFPGDWL